MRHGAQLGMVSARQANGMAWLLATLVGVAVLLALGASVMGLLNSVEPPPPPAVVAPAPVLVAEPAVSASDRVVQADDDLPRREHGHGGKGKHGHKKHHHHGH